MYVRTLRGVELWYNQQDPKAEFWAQDYLKFEKNFERREKTLPVYRTVYLTLATLFSAFMWYASGSWPVGLFVLSLLWLVIIQVFGAAKKGMQKFDPNVALIELQSHGVIDTKNDPGFVLLTQVLARSNPTRRNLDDYDPKLVSKVVPGYLKAAAAIVPIHHWWAEELPNAQVLAQEAASRLVREAG